MENINTKESYPYRQIEIQAIKKGYLIDEYGRQLIGENFIVVRDDKHDMVCSFILTSANSRDFYYTCIYNQWLRNNGIER